MKKCDQFRDMILTDFIDGQLGQDARAKVEEHLLDCRDCQAFLKEVKSNASMPFQQAAQQPVPAELWEGIKEQIEGKGRLWNPLEGLLEQFKGLFALPRLVPVFASLALMLIVGSVTLNNIQVQEAKDQDQGEYLVAMLSPASTTADSNDLGTPIEHYFL